MRHHAGHVPDLCGRLLARSTLLLLLAADTGLEGPIHN